jgi:hypothetical protein
MKDGVLQYKMLEYRSTIKARSFLYLELKKVFQIKPGFRGETCRILQKIPAFFWIFLN